MTIKASSVMAGPEVAAGQTHTRDDKLRGAGVSMIMAEASERGSKRSHGAEHLLASPAVDMSIVICTLDRPQGMARAVRSCLEQQNRSDCSYEILIVDNSATARARDLVQESWGGSSDCVRYLNEARTNVAHARNAGIAAARGKYIAFMDDDMSAPPDWLANAIEVMERTGADVLLGKVVPEFEGDGGWGGALSDPARWFGRVLALPEASIVPTKRDGHIPGAGSGNCVLRGSTLHEPAPFDPEFGRVGGEDTDFLQRLGQRGAVTVFSERAWMTEFVPADRNTPAYLVRRSYRTSQQFVRIMAKNSPRPRLTVCRHMAAGAVQLALAVSRYGAAVVTGADPIRARIAAAAALGKLLWMGYDASGPYR